MILLIDADSALYKAGMANEVRSYWVVDNHTGYTVCEFEYKKDADQYVEVEEKGDKRYSITRVKELKGPISHTLSNLNRVCEQMLAPRHTGYKMFIGGGGNFRYEIYPDYKLNRRDADRPIHLEEMREHLIRKYGAVEVMGEEVDDRVSWEQCLSTVPTCIVSIDKDLLNTPGAHFNYDKDSYLEITEEVANYNFAKQLLSGDSTDNVKGIPGIGSVGANKILPKPTEDWKEQVLGQYCGFFGEETAEKEMLINGRCLWLRREPEQMWNLSTI